MKTIPGHKLPEERLPDLRRAKRLQIATLLYMPFVVVLMGLVMGNSQAMRAAWIEDMLVFVPPIAFLIAIQIRKRSPTHRFPYGYHRSVGIAFLVSALALLAFGGILFYESVTTLIRREHPSIGTMNFFGTLVWQGWLMLAVLIFSVIGPVILGRLMIKPAEALHDKVLYATSSMLKADWMTAAAASIGILGISVGWWWADAIAAGVISLDILNDGWRHLRAVIGDLMDRTPETTKGDREDPLVEQLKQHLQKLPWVRDVALRMRESGHVLAVEVSIVPIDEREPLRRIREGIKASQSLHWRINSVTVQLTAAIRDEPADRTAKEIRQTAANA